MSGIIIAGKSGSGKNVLFDRLFENCDYDGGLVYSPTAGITNDFKGHQHVYDDHNVFLGKLAILLENQRKRAIAKVHLGKYYIVINDFIGCIDVHQTKVYDKLFTQGRHLCMTIYVLTQSLSAVTPTMRANIMCLYVTVLNDQQVDYIYSMVRGFENKKALKKYLSDNCVNYNVLVFDQKPYGKPYKVMKSKC